MDEDDRLFCDCSAAKDAVGTPYVGKWCEHAGQNHCDNYEDKFTFCLNNGECNRRYPLHGSPCNCPEGYEGPHCEYQTSQDLPTCALQCQNGGVCKLGHGDGLEDVYKAYWGDEDTDGEEFQYCHCPTGYHGAFCEVDSVQCGDDRCYHGGTCIAKTIDDVTEYYCDCDTAGDEEIFYAGQFCQYESTETCNDDDESNFQGNLFCVNGGTCLPDPHLGCNCTTGYSGFSCEFRIEEDAEEGPAPGYDPVDAAECNLDCHGRGTCRKGAKSTEALGVAAEGNYLNQTSSETFEHCVCQPGFVGVQCEHLITACPVDNNATTHFCLHNGTCMEGIDGSFSCDCSTAQGPLGEIFTGDHCQHPATSCHDPEASGDTLTSFCANGGICLDVAGNDGKHVGCECEKEWTGNFCEESVHAFASTTSSSQTDSPSRSEKLAISMTMVLIAAVALLVFVALRQRSNRRHFHKEPNKAMDWNISQYEDEFRTVHGMGKEENLSPRARHSSAGSSSRDPMVTFAVGSTTAGSVYLGPERDEDGHELSNVELL